MKANYSEFSKACTSTIVTVTRLIIIIIMISCVCLSVTEGQQKRLDLEPSYAVSLATER